MEVPSSWEAVAPGEVEAPADLGEAVVPEVEALSVDSNMNHSLSVILFSKKRSDSIRNSSMGNTKADRFFLLHIKRSCSFFQKLRPKQSVSDN